MISKELFTKIINELLEDYNRGFEKDRLLTKAFGGDSSVFQENILLDRMLKILKEEFNDEYDFIDWLFFECLVNGKNLSFTYDEKEYVGNIENIYDYLNGCLQYDRLNNDLKTLEQRLILEYNKISNNNTRLEELFKVFDITTE